MIIKEIKLGNTIIKIDDSCLVTEEEKDNIYKQFNEVACEILRERS